jgi:hypothetical protein
MNCLNWGELSPEEMINSLTRSQWSIPQKNLCRVVITKCLDGGEIEPNTIAGIILGMSIGGPLGRGCPTWRVNAITENIESGVPWRSALWGINSET